MKNTFGSDLSLTIFGESHGWAVGAVLDGMAAGVPVDEAFVAACMDKRRARGDGLSTPRTEADAVQFLSGVVNGCTTGTAIALMVENQNTRTPSRSRGGSIAFVMGKPSGSTELTRVISARQIRLVSACSNSCVMAGHLRLLARPAAGGVHGGDALSS